MNFVSFDLDLNFLKMRIWSKFYLYLLIQNKKYSKNNKKYLNNYLLKSEISYGILFKLIQIDNETFI